MRECVEFFTQHPKYCNTKLSVAHTYPDAGPVDMTLEVMARTEGEVETIFCITQSAIGTMYCYIHSILEETLHHVIRPYPYERITRSEVLTDGYRSR